MTDEPSEFDFSRVDDDDDFLSEFGGDPLIGQVSAAPVASSVMTESASRRRGRSTGRRRLAIVLGVVVVLAAAAAVFFVVTRDDGQEGEAGGAAAPAGAPSPADVPAASTDVGGATAEPVDAGDGGTDTAESTPVDGAEQVDLPSFDLPMLGLFDSFGRPDSDSLGVSESGQDWVEDAGSWGIESGGVVITDPNPSGPSLAIANARTNRGTVQVTMPAVERASGIVFRYRNSFNYWSMTAAPDAGTWSISKVVAGEATQIGTVGLAPVRDFTTIAVRFDTDLAEIFVDGIEVASFIDADAIDGTYVGLIGRGPEAVDARWTNFVVIGQAEPSSP